MTQDLLVKLTVKNAETRHKFDENKNIIVVHIDKDIIFNREELISIMFRCHSKIDITSDLNSTASKEYFDWLCYQNCDANTFISKLKECLATADDYKFIEVIAENTEDILPENLISKERNFSDYEDWWDYSDSNIKWVMEYLLERKPDEEELEYARDHLYNNLPNIYELLHTFIRENYHLFYKEKPEEEIEKEEEKKEEGKVQ